MKIITKLLKNILFDTVVYTVIVLLISNLLKNNGYVFLVWFKNFNFILISLGIIIGTIQTYYQIVKDKLNRTIIIIVTVFFELLIILSIAFFFFIFQNKEEIVYKNNKKMIVETKPSSSCFYDYENVFIRNVEYKFCS